MHQNPKSNCLEKPQVRDARGENTELETKVRKTNALPSRLKGLLLGKTILAAPDLRANG